MTTRKFIPYIVVFFLNFDSFMVDFMQRLKHCREVSCMSVSVTRDLIKFS